MNGYLAQLVERTLRINKSFDIQDLRKVACSIRAVSTSHDYFVIFFKREECFWVTIIRLREYGNLTLRFWLSQTKSYLQLYNEPSTDG